MCGRYSLFDEQDNREIMDILTEINNKYPDNEMKTGEIYPTNTVPVLLSENQSIVPELCTWGFPKFQGNGVIINARSETATEKKMFRDSLLFRRCVIPSTGFYEWSQGANKQKYLFQLPNQLVLYMAGFYNEYQGQRRFVILTTQANSSMADIHNRMPVILPPERKEEWITNKEAALGYLHEGMSTLVHEVV